MVAPSSENNNCIEKWVFGVEIVPEIWQNKVSKDWRIIKLFESPTGLL